MDYVRNIFAGYSAGGHLQGIAVDAAREHIYCSFTTELLKLDMAGHIVGSVRGLVGHLGCLCYNDADGRVYGSLEYKNDAIGASILARNGRKSVKDAFYAVSFDVDRIDRVGMDAFRDGIMRASYLRCVTEDYLAEQTVGGKALRHRHGCSGIDGISFGPGFGSRDGKRYLCVACGIYGDVTRTDNDCQVIWSLDTSDWDALALPLDQDSPHASGVEPRAEYFVYTGNTEYGVQNLEYDAFTGNWFAAVYTGKKPEFPNYPMFVIDGSTAPVRRDIPGYGEVDALSLAQVGETHAASGIRGLTFDLGSTGMISLGDSYWYFSDDRRARNGAYCSDISLWKWNGAGFDPVPAR